MSNAIDCHQFHRFVEWKIWSVQKINEQSPLITQFHIINTVLCCASSFICQCVGRNTHISHIKCHAVFGYLYYHFVGQIVIVCSNVSVDVICNVFVHYILIWRMFYSNNVYINVVPPARNQYKTFFRALIER